LKWLPETGPQCHRGHQLLPSSPAQATERVGGCDRSRRVVGPQRHAIPSSATIVGAWCSRASNPSGSRRLDRRRLGARTGVHSGMIPLHANPRRPSTASRSGWVRLPESWPGLEASRLASVANPDEQKLPPRQSPSESARARYIPGRTVAAL